MSDADPTFESASVAAILAQSSREDGAALLDELVAVLSQIVPGVQVERSFFRRQVTAVRLPLGGFVYQLKRTSGRSFEASRQQEVRGVVIRTEPMEIDAFLPELGLALEVELRLTFLQALKQIGRNREMTVYTEATYAARELSSRWEPRSCPWRVMRSRSGSTPSSRW